MLLKRLTQYAERDDVELPPPFYRVRHVRWAIRLNHDGTAAAPGLSDLAGSDQPAGQPLPVPYIYRAGPRPPAMLLADSLQYVMNFNGESPKRIGGDSAWTRHQDFVELVGKWRDSASENPVAAAVASFFEDGRQLGLEIPEAAKATDVAAIMIDGEWMHERPSAVAFWGAVARERKTSSAAGICLVCGNPGTVLETIPEAVKAGAIPAGTGRGRDAQLVSVNKAAQGRGGRLQLASAPVCDRCGSVAMSALNSLLAEKSSRYRMSDSVLAWWVHGNSDFSEVGWLNQPEPKQVSELIRELYVPHAEPAVGGVEPDDFCAVTLSANQSRVVVRDWLEVPLTEARKSIARWFADHRATDWWQDGLHAVPLWRMAACAGRWGSENGQERYLPAFMPHGCERDLLLSALRGTPPPPHLLPHLLQRIRADRHVDVARAALLRLLLVRPAHSEERNYMAGLDPDLPSPPYQCGRMFAVLEQIQRAALGGQVNTTIADKYLPAATATPLAILTMLRKNANGHLKRLRRSSTGAYYALNSSLDEVLEHLGADHGIPATLSLAGQAEFILGYHHQRAADLATARARAAEKQQAETTNTGEAQ